MQRSRNFGFFYSGCVVGYPISNYTPPLTDNSYGGGHFHITVTVKVLGNGGRPIDITLEDSED